MKTFFSDILPSLFRFSKKLDDLSSFTNRNWLLINKTTDHKTVYIFRPEKLAIISEAGIAKIGKWEYLGNESILLTIDDKHFLLRHAFLDDNVLILLRDGTDEFLFLVDENNRNIKLNNIASAIQYLKEKYISTSVNISNNLPVQNTFPNYIESKGKIIYHLINGKILKTTITFPNGISGDIYMEYPNEEYYFIHSKRGKVYGYNKEQCISQMFQDRVKL